MAEIRDIRNQPFYWLETNFLDQYGALIKASGIAVYNALARRANQSGTAYPGIRDIMALTGLSKRTVQRTLKRLVDVNLIRIERRRTSDGDADTNLYVLLPIGEPAAQRETLAEMPAEPAPVLVPSPGDQVTQDHEPPLAPDSSALPVTALSLLAEQQVNLAALNGQAVSVAAWLVYALSQPGIKKPGGYAFVQGVRRQAEPPPACLELVTLDIPWAELTAIFAAQRKSIAFTGYLSADAPLWVEQISEAAWTVLEAIVPPDEKYSGPGILS